LYAATGQGLSSADTAAPAGFTGTFTEGTVTLGNAAAVPGLTTQQQEILNEIAYEEQEHVRFLRSALGSSAVPMPSIDLSFFGPLAVAAGITGATFNHFPASTSSWSARSSSKTSASQPYAGAAPLISSAEWPPVSLRQLPDSRSGGLSCSLHPHGYHRSAIAAGSAAAFPYITAANQVAALRAMLTVGNSGAPGTATGNTGAPGSSSSVETPLALPTSLTTPSSIVAADPVNALGFARTVDQVLHVVYGSPTVGVASGGFFPNGVNSIFAKTTA